MKLNDDDRIAAIAAGESLDRKSTRLNSSHTVISYAVFCLKKKKKMEVVCRKQHAAHARADTYALHEQVPNCRSDAPHEQQDRYFRLISDRRPSPIYLSAAQH